MQHGQQIPSFKAGVTPIPKTLNGGLWPIKRLYGPGLLTAKLYDVDERTDKEM